MKIQKTKFKIEGMHCSSCAMNIDFDVEDLDGIKKVRTNYAKQISEVEFEEGKTSKDEIINQIKKTGYKAIVINEI